MSIVKNVAIGPPFLRWLASAAMIFLVSQMPNSAFSQGLQAEIFAHEHGISQTNITSIAQDQQGFIWFGTQDGLNRFDGYEFKVYKPEVGNPNTISNNSVWALLVDHEGMLWAGTYDGLNQFDPSNERFKSFHHDENDPHSLSSDSISALLQDNDGSIWVGTRDGLNHFDPKQQVFTQFVHQQGTVNRISNNIINCLYKDRDGALWIGTDRGLNRYDVQTKLFTQILSSKDSDKEARLRDAVVYSITEDAQGRLWVGTDGEGLFVYNKLSQTLSQYKHDPRKEYSILSDSIKSLFKDQHDRLWVGTDAGLVSSTLSENQFIPYGNRDNADDVFSGDAIFSIFEDRTGVLWVGTYSRGIVKLSQKSFGHTLVSDQATAANPKPQARVRAFYVDHQGALWVGSNGDGLHKTDKQGRKTVYMHDPDNSSSISRNEIFSILEDQKGVVWVGTEGGWLNRYNRSTDSFTRFHSQLNHAESLRHGRVRALMEDHQGVFWVGIEGGGLHTFDRNTHEFKHYHYDALKPDSIKNNAVFSLHEDRSNNIWVATLGGGLNKFDPVTQSFTHYMHNPNNKQSISSDHVLSIYEDEKEDVLWLGTNGGGLNRFDVKRNRFTYYDENNGLVNNAIYGVIQDDHGRVWVTTNKGVSRFDPQTETFKNYDKRDGLQGDEYNGGAYYKDARGKIYFGGLKGYNAFYPDEIVDNLHKPDVYITEFYLFNHKVEVNERYGDRILLPKSVSLLDELTLSYKETVFSFKFIALNYIVSSKNRYAYMMEGLEEEWNYVGDRRFASYTTLPPGNYVFRVKASNNNGVWNEEGASIAITITPPFWQTWWFRLLLGVLGLLSLSAIYAVRVKHIKAANKLLKHEVRLRTSELEGQKANLELTLNELQETKDAFEQSSQVATGVLHNVGNLLNSVNTSASLVQGVLHNSAMARYAKANEMLRAKMEQIEDFISRDPKGKKLLNYYLEMEKPLFDEKDLLIENVSRLMEKISAIKDAITAQQRSAKGQGFIEALSLEELVNDTITLQAGNIIANDIKVVKKYNALPDVKVEKAKLVQILFNLYKNARESMEEARTENKTITIELMSDETYAYIKVSDSGLGIAKEKLKKMFSYGFTTKSEGHGFGLHSCANYMVGMGGKMSVESEGLGKGATFILRLPLVWSPEKVSQNGAQAH